MGERERYRGEKEGIRGRKRGRDRGEREREEREREREREGRKKKFQTQKIHGIYFVVLQSAERSEARQWIVARQVSCFNPVTIKY